MVWWMDGWGKEGRGGSLGLLPTSVGGVVVDLESSWGGGGRDTQSYDGRGGGVGWLSEGWMRRRKATSG